MAITKTGSFYRIIVLFACASVILLASFTSRVIASSFSISTSTSALPGQTIKVTLFASRSTAYNTVELELGFTNLSFLTAEVIGGWTPVAGPINRGESVSFAGALLGSSATGRKEILNISFKTLKIGEAKIFVRGTIDGTGLGTDKSEATGEITIKVVQQATPTSTTLNQNQNRLPSQLSLSSDTHPEQNKWYKNDFVRISWDKSPSVIGFSYAINGDPDNIIDTENSYFEQALSEGINVFKIKPKNEYGWGPVSEYTVKIDKNPPHPFTPTIRKVQDGLYEVYFHTYDELTKVRYTVKINNGSVQERELGYIKIEDELIDNMEVQAIDEAGNSQVYTYELAKEVESKAISGYTDLNKEIGFDNKNYSTDKVYGLIPDWAIPLLIATIVMLCGYSVVISYLYFFKKEKAKTTVNNPASRL